VTGSSQEKRFGLWTAALDGSDLREVVRGEVGTGQVLVASDGAVAFVRVARGRATPLFLAQPGTDPVEVLPWATEIALGPDGVYAAAVTARADGTVADDGVWLLPTGAERMGRVVPPREGPGCDPELFGERTRTGVTATAPFIATAVCVPEGRGGFRLAIDVFDRAGGSSTMVDVNARPIGFDPAGRLVAHGDDGFVAIHPTTRVPTPIPGDPGGQARLAGGGRWLVTFAGGREVTAHDLNDGRPTTWELPAGGTFDLTPWTDETHAVLESFAQFPAGDVQPGWHAVLALEEGWIGYLPPIAPLRDDPRE
jgi:hypothetical protein